MYKVSKSVCVCVGNAYTVDIRAICGQHVGAYIVPESQINHPAVDSCQFVP
jgi:hypothetical protein